MAAKKKAAAKADGPSAEDLGTDVGFIGTKVDPRPNSDYSLESGPESPSALESRIERHDAEAAALADPNKSTAAE